MEGSKSVFTERTSSRLLLAAFRCLSEECLESDLVLLNDRIYGKTFSRRFLTDFSEPKTAVFILGDKDPIILFGELEDSSANCFCIRNGDRMQFYKYTDNVQLNPQYLFSIRSLLDERIKLCTGGQGRFLTSRLGLPYHIQVYDFPKANKKGIKAIFAGFKLL